MTCLQGALHDVVLDLRAGVADLRRSMPRSSSRPATGAWWSSREGCAHGFLTACDATLLLYMVTAAYDPVRERAVRWDDPAFAIDWPAAAAGDLAARRPPSPTSTRASICAA